MARVAAACACVCALLGGVDAMASERPRQGSLLYYRLGGGDPAARPSNRSPVSVRLNLGATLRLNYSCGKFDVGLSWQTLMNGFAALGTAVTGAVRAGIASLPMYIFQRAAPGLYQLFQTYSEKADILVSQAMKTCEEMEAQIKAGGDPYADWVAMAKGESWRAQASLEGDVVSAKASIERNGGQGGTTWIGGGAKGGVNQAPIEVVRDLVTAGYNATLNQPVTASPTLDYAAGGAFVAEKLPKLFRRPVDAAAFAVDVLGESRIATCDDLNCPPKGTSTGYGLAPKYEAEAPFIQGAVNALLAGPLPSASDLDAASAPGVVVTREVVEALRELPAHERGIAAQRLGKEIALARTIDKALTVRNLLLTSLTLPEVTAAPPAVRSAESKIATLNRYIDDLLFENRVRREVVSATAATLLQAYHGARAQSEAVGTAGAPDPRPIRDGRVQ